MKGKIAVVLGAAVALCSWGATAQTASVVVQQTINGEHLELNGADYDNSVSVDIDLSDVVANPSGINTEEGDFNLQENTADVPLSADTAKASVQQELLDSSFNRDSAELTPSQVFNSATVNVNLQDENIGIFGLNAAAGAFNIQSNAAALAPVPAGELATATGDVGQLAQRDIAIQSDTTNELTANIHLEGVIGVIGINAATGGGNLQSNTASIASQF